MQLYYKAASEDGKILHGIIQAKDQREVISYLRKQLLVPIRIEVYKENELISALRLFKKSPKSKLVFFTRQLSTMMTSGLTLMQALTILKNQVHNDDMKKIIESIVSDVQDGKPLSSAIEKYPEVFSPIYTSLVKAAESAGVLDKVLARLADNLEKSAKLKTEIKTALIYPVIVIATMGLVVVVMMVFVVPQLATLYTSLNVELPLSTKIIIGMSNFMINFWYLLIGIIVSLIVFGRKWSKTPGGKFILDKFVIKVPILGKLIVESTLVEFTRTLGFLISTGSHVVDSLTKSGNTIGNRIYKDAVVEVTKKVEKGVTMGDAMAVDDIFPPILVEMVKVGEKTGKLDDSLTRVSEYFEGEVAQIVKTLTIAMEPIILIILAVGVGFLVLSIITPIYTIISSIK